MGKLVLYYATMNSGKSFDLIRTDYNYRESGFKTLVLKPSKDTKADDFISTRAGLKRKVDYLIGEEDSIIERLSGKLNDIACIFIDEAQFLNKSQVKELRLITAATDVPIICYALRLNFKGELFEGSEALFTDADKIVELQTLCPLCEKENIARYVGRKVNGEFVIKGKEVVIDGSKDNVEYIPLCEKHFLEEVKHEDLKLVRRKVYER